MKILIVGAGGVGGYFGAKLLESGLDVTFLLRGKRHEHIQKSGLTIEADGNKSTVFPKIVTAEELKPTFDLIILACKAYDLEDALTSIKNALSIGVILPFLNGLDHLEILDERFGRSRVMGGIANIAANINSTGVVQRLTDVNLLTIGARSEEHLALAKEFYGECEKADFNAVYSENITQNFWDKWITLSTLAAVTTLFRAPIGKIVASSFGLAILEKAFSEACAIASSSGYAISEERKMKGIESLSKVNSPLTASMLRDWIGGFRTEHEHILGSLVKRGVDLKIECDLLKIAYTNLEMNSNY